MVRILVVDDHPAMRQGVKSVLADQPDLAVMGEAGDAEQALRLARARRWDLVILDLTLPDRSGLEVLQDLRRDHPDLPVLILSLHPEEPFAAATRQAGAAGYVTKGRADRELVGAIRAILSGGGGAKPPREPVPAPWTGRSAIMGTPLRVLILEDDAADAELMVEALRQAGFAPGWERVESPADFLARLDSGWDLILADQTLPQWSAPGALALLQQQRLDIPFIVVSGTISEEVAVACMRQGAADYLLKDRLVRLGEAARHALEARRLRAEREALLRAEQSRLRQLEAIRAVTLEMTRELDLAALLGLITRRAVELLEADGGAVFLWDPEAQLLVPRAWHGIGDRIRDVRLRMGEDVTGLVARDRKGLIVNDYVSWSHVLSTIPDRSDVLAIMAEPLLYHKELLGVIHVQARTPGKQFTSEDLAFLGLFAAQAAIAIENARVYAEAERRRRIAEAVTRVSAMVTAALDLATVAGAIGRAVVELLDAPLVQVMVPGPARGHLVVAASIGEPALTRHDPCAPTGWLPLSEAAFATGEGVYAVPISGEPGYVDQEWAARHGLRTFLAVPLRAGGEKVGVLALHRREARRLTADEMAVLATFADQAAMAVQNARLYEEARGAREFLGSIAANTTDAILTLDLDGRFTYFSPGGERMLGYRAEDILGRPEGQIEEEGVKALQAMIQRLRAEGHILDRQALVQARDGRRLDVSISLAPLRDGGGSLAGTLAILRDITERTRAQEALRKLFRAVEQSPASIMITDAGGAIEYVNPKFTEVTGYAPEEVMGRNPRILKSEETPPETHRALWASITAGREWRGEFCNRRKDGTLFWEAASISPIRNADGVITHFVAVKEDITQRRRVEQQLRQNEKLATMGQLLAGVAHELNNPLSIVMGQAALLEAGMGGVPPGERARRIVEAAERCGRIVRNFLSLARQRPPEQRPVAINQVVQEAVEMLAYQLRAAGVQVTQALGAGLPMLLADPHQLHQVVVNLVVNALQAMRAAPPPRQLTLTTGHEAAGGRVWLEVADSGPGIPPEILPRLFEPFFTTKPPEEGTGLGLSLCQGIVESHGGTIGAGGAPGRGAVFRVELPVPAAAAAAAGEETGDHVPPPPGKAILVVDDEPVVVDVLAELLRADGHQVDAAANGAMALARLAERPYDLIVSDIRMPEMDGETLYREVQARHPALSRRFVFLTGDLLTRDTRRFLEQTGVATLGKPFVMDEVRRVVARTLRSAR